LKNNNIEKTKKRQNSYFPPEPKEYWGKRKVFREKEGGKRKQKRKRTGENPLKGGERGGGAY